ncbi:MAG: DUF4115 domain-containing protein [candidate division NC10 bacterium]|nr:DUF4115 domain-containing protein [candidate division NC10 bacterium]MBI2116613.1 DUF4115 domain-containing protein [candidate division NC10 bacterium]MBI3084680.1 DUF4115 domain-containing protein [candidate division NC10 bacterium]MBI3121119.1 DUF4115 domain-containing protein [candidate division NC10 bacterium]
MADKASIGQTLRERREERGLSPEQAAFQSRVPLRLLQALEADDYRLLPDAAYLIRFLQDYARLLKLDPDVLAAEFRKAIRRPPGTSLVAVPPPTPPLMIPWKQVLWTLAAILVITPLVFIVLSLASKRAAERRPPPVVERPVEEQAAAEGQAPTSPERAVTGSPAAGQPGGAASPAEAPAPPPNPTTAGPAQGTSPPPAPAVERPPRRFQLTARAVEATWMAVRADGGQERQVLLQKGQMARFAADTGFVITVGNAGGVDLSLNGQRVPSLGISGQVVRDLAMPPIPGPEPSGATPPGAVPAPPGR